ncbi:retrovirus-related pol polyprotein from transposon TNT 1-94 [Tanacetum coccineum]
MDTCKNDLKLDSSLFEQFQKFLVMYEKFEIFLDMLEQLKKFLAFEPYAMSTSSKNGFASFSKWILDSGATHHMSYLLSQFISMNLNSSKSILAANGDSMPLVGIGSVDTHFVALSDVYYIPNLTMNLASVSKICDTGCDVNFSVSDCCIYDRKTQEVVGKGHRQGDLYVLDHFRDIYDTTSSSVDFGCKLAKFSAQPFSNSISSSTAPFDLVHSDVWGPAPVSTKGGSRYYVSFIDDFTRYTWVYLMKQRSDFLTIFKEFRALVKTQHSAVIKCFRCDLGDTPQQNGVAERKRRHLVETARSFLLSADVPSVFWGEAVLTAIYVINRIPTAHNYGLSPFEKLYGTSPDYSSLRVFGCTCFVLKPHVERMKLSTKSTLCVFLGYGVSQKGYRCYDPVGQKLYTSRHVDFLEHIPYYSVPASSHNLTQSELIKIDPFEEPTPIVSPIPPEPALETTSETTTTAVIIFEATPTVTQPPSTTNQSSSEVAAVPLANVAMAEELATLHQTQTWDLVPLPVGNRAIGSRWVYKIKTKSDGSIERYKARLVAKGYAQEYGMDYEETFAPVAKMTIVRTLIAVASSRKWKIFQLDVKNAFLNGDLNEEVFMKPPPGVSHKPGEVYKLRKALYGLKQAPRAWYEKFATVVTSFGFVSSHHDSILFIKQSSVGRILLSLYVDDMIITGDDCVGIESLKLELAHRFAMKDLGLLRYFLGIKVASSPKGYLLSQSKYIGDLLDRARITDKMVEDIPIDAKAKYTPTDGDPLPDLSFYRTIVGSLVYLTVTRPNISYAVHIMSQFVSAPTTVHWAAVLHILRYLRGTQFQTLLFPSTSALDLRAYCDSDWAGDVVSPEYRAMAVTTSEIVWLRWLLSDMGVRISHSTPLYCDNRSAIQIARNSVFHERTKHIELDCHFTRHHLQGLSLYRLFHL